MTGGWLGAVGQLLVVLGVALVAVGALGLLRLPDAYLRANAVTKAAALGLVLLLLGAAVLVPGTESTVVLVVAAALQLFSVPVAGYAVGAAAHRSGAPFDPRTQRDDLRSAGSQREGEPSRELGADGEGPSG